MDIKLDRGMSSILFVTDADRGISVAHQPFVILSDQKLSIVLLAEILSALITKNNESNLLKFLNKNSNPDLITKLLQDCSGPNQDGSLRLEVLVGLPPRPLVIISGGVERAALNAMKVLKIRGVVSFLQINLKQLSVSEMCTRAGQLKNSKEVLRCHNFHVFGSNSIVALSGLKETIISDQPSREVLKCYPEIISSKELLDSLSKQDIFSEGECS